MFSVYVIYVMYIAIGHLHRIAVYYTVVDNVVYGKCTMSYIQYTYDK